MATDQLSVWLMVFLRVSGLFALFPVFSAQHCPVRLRTALGALVAFLVLPAVPPLAPGPQTVAAWILVMVQEVGIGLLLGFTSRMVFFAVEVAGSLITTEVGISLTSVLNPINSTQATTPAVVLNYLTAVVWLSLDLHHWMLAAFQRTYALVPIGGVHLREALLTDLLSRCSEVFVVALQMAAPVMAVSFIISLVFSVLGRAVPQMNVFSESFGIRILAGLAVFGLTCQLMAQHIINYLNRLPEDVLRVAQALGPR
jgi:flagellar biosynthesis protein FliR